MQVLDRIETYEKEDVMIAILNIIDITIMIGFYNEIVFAFIDTRCIFYFFNKFFIIDITIII